MIIQNGIISNIRGGTGQAGKEWKQFQLRCRNSETKEYSNFFISCYCFGRNADYISKYVASGDTVIVSGNLVPKSYKDKDGNEKNTFQIFCLTVEKITQKDTLNDEINIVKGE